MTAFNWQKVSHFIRVLAAAGALLSLLIITSGVCFSRLMPMDRQDLRLSCAAMDSASMVFCPMQFAKMIADGRNVFLALTENGRALLTAIIAAVFALVAFALGRHFCARAGPERKLLNTLLRRNFILKSLNYLLEAYSRGILQPKLYA